MLTFGAQKVRPAWPRLLNARASVPTTWPIAWKSEVFHDDAVVITCGNDVAFGVVASKVTPGDRPTPWSASLHH